MLQDGARIARAFGLKQAEQLEDDDDHDNDSDDVEDVSVHIRTGIYQGAPVSSTVSSNLFSACPLHWATSPAGPTKRPENRVIFSNHWQFESPLSLPVLVAVATVAGESTCSACPPWRAKAFGVRII